MNNIERLLQAESEARINIANAQNKASVSEMQAELDAKKEIAVHIKLFDEYKEEKELELLKDLSDIENSNQQEIEKIVDEYININKEKAIDEIIKIIIEY